MPTRDRPVPHAVDVRAAKRIGSGGENGALMATDSGAG